LINQQVNVRSIVLGLAILVLFYSQAVAQKSVDAADSTETSTSAEKKEYSTRRNEIGFWGGVSTVHKDLAGASAGGNFGILAFRYSHSIRESSSMKLKYLLDIAPVAVLNYPRTRIYQVSPGVTRTVRDRTTVYGAGFAPGGLQLNFRNRKKYQPFLAGSLGFMYFTKIVPDNRTPLQPRATGAKINYTGDLGGGLEIGMKNNRNFIVGYKYYHMSNLYTGNINIGYNSNMIYAGMNFGL